MSERKFNVGDRVRVVLRGRKMSEEAAQIAFNEAMDLQRLRMLMQKICGAIDEPDWESATAEVIRRIGRLNAVRNAFEEEGLECLVEEGRSGPCHTCGCWPNDPADDDDRDNCFVRKMQALLGSKP